MSYWVYENWTVGRARIHVDGCNHMKSGEKTPSGQWHGPFETEAAGLSVQVHQRAAPIRPCGFCMRSSTRLPRNGWRPRPRLDGAPSQRLDALIHRIDEHLDRFEAERPFTDEQVQIHRTTIDRRHRHASIDSLLDDDEFFRLLEEVLKAWRMASRAARLLPRDQIWEAFASERDALDFLWGQQLTILPVSAASRTLTELGRLLTAIRVSGTNTNLIAGAKAVHHVLPDLIPPIDREYTLRFFGFGQTFRESAAIERCLAGFHQIAWHRPEQIEARVGPGMHTSLGKVIDNAIVGYLVGELQRPDP